MSDTTASLLRKIGSASDLQSVVRTMKAVAAASVGQYEQSVLALGDYYRTVELGLSACVRAGDSAADTRSGTRREQQTVGAIVFGSDQGLVGQFNEVVVDFAVKALAEHGEKVGRGVEVFAVGERVYARLSDAGITPVGLFGVPTSVNGITPLVGEIQIKSERRRSAGDYASVYVFHNRPKAGALYEPVSERLLPLDAEWVAGLKSVDWPTRYVPQIIGGAASALHPLIREYLFISLFRACAESLASENASRLAAMQRADKNIDELLEHLSATFHRLRQSGIDEELFDVISGFEALNAKETA